jgi:putative oxidoreductase
MDFALLLNRMVVGAFFVLSGHRKLFDANRHAALVETLRACGIPFIEFNQWFVPLVEFFGGLAVISGLLAPFAAFGMIIILAVAALTDGPKHIRAYGPIDGWDYLCDVLYLPEILYAAMLAGVIIVGPGRYSLYVFF